MCASRQLITSDYVEMLNSASKNAVSVPTKMCDSVVDEMKGRLAGLSLRVFSEPSSMSPSNGPMLFLQSVLGGKESL
jgi:hypothetical protein